MTKEKFLKRFKDFPMSCKECSTFIYECTSMDICDHIRNKLIEYKTDTSAQLLNEGEDIVRPILNNEGIESQDKEPAR